MLRRRKSLSDNGDKVDTKSESILMKRKREEDEKAKKERMAKLKMSPFPEERGYVVPLKETQRINQLSEVKMSLSFSGAEKASPALKNSPLLSPPDQSANEQGSYSSFAAGLKPSNVVELQKHVSPPTRQQNLTKTGNKNRNNLSTAQSQMPPSLSEDQPSASIKTMWDSVVSWMKTAVDYIAFENPEDVMATKTISPHGKKRPLTDADSAVSDVSPAAAKRTRSSMATSDRGDNDPVIGRGRRGSFGRQKKKNGRRMSFGGLRRAAAGASGDGGLGELLKLEPIKECSHSPPKVKQSATSTSLPIFSSSSSSLLSPNSSPSKETADSITCSSGVRNEAVIKSPTRALAGQLSRNLSIKSPLLSSSSQSEPKLTALPKHMQVQGRAAGSKVCKTSSLLTSAMRFHSGNDGLNSILDGSPDPIPGVEAAGVVNKKKQRIRRESLRQFYGNSLNSPNLTEVPRSVIQVRRSPRLAEKDCNPPSMTSTPVADSDKIPIPPPPPPIPFSVSKSSLTPLASHVPPPPPTPQIHSMELDSTNNSDFSDNLSAGDGRVPLAINHSRDMLQKMQSRLRKKMKKRGGVGGAQDVGTTGGETKDKGKLDVRVKQWAEIQAYSRKMSLNEFLSFADQKKMELQTAMEKLKSCAPLGSLDDITSVVELLQESSQWFPGGSKEMKDTLPLYKTLEKKIEVLTEFVQVSGEMTRCCLIDQPVTDLDSTHSNFYTTLNHARDEFESKHRHWGTILTSNAVSWTELNLPVCHMLLSRSHCYLCRLVLKCAHLSLREASKMNGILVSMKCVRTTQVKEKLKECLQMMQMALPYFPKAPPTVGECSCHHCPTTREHLDRHQMSLQQDYSQDVLLRSAVGVALSYITVAQDQFSSFVRLARRQEVCEHFEGILKIVSLLKQLVSKLPGVGHQLKTTGIISLLPDAEELSSAVHTSCVDLIQHIVNQAKPYLGNLSPHSKENKSKEVMLWMMFGCKYVNQTLEALGAGHTDEGGILGLLNDLQQMECLLPD